LAFSNGWQISDMMKALDHQYQGVRFRLLDEQVDISRHIAMFDG